MTVIDKLRNYWQAEQFDQLAGSYSSDALLDIYVPAGRMQYRGTQSIIAFWRLDFGRPRQFRFLHWREHPTTWGRSSKHRSLTSQPANTSAGSTLSSSSTTGSSITFCTAPAPGPPRQPSSGSPIWTLKPGH
jgi:hypothetical protein